MSAEQSLTLTAAYGEAILYGYLIEDLLQLHLYECSYYHVNGYEGHSKSAIREMKFFHLIREFQAVYPEQTTFADGLDKIRLIRNKLAHAWIDQLGSDLETEEGRDQIYALVSRTIQHEHRYLKALKRTHDELFRHSIKHNLEAALARDDEPFEARVSTSEIQRLLDELDAINDT